MELIDVLNPDGSPAGTTKPKSDVHRDGDWHRSVHIWIIAPNGRILAQRRALTKENHPGQWDIACAGHIAAGETAIDSAIRETREELGIELTPGDLRHVATLREQHVLNCGAYIDNEIHEIFVVYRNVELSSLQLQVEEVDDARFVTREEFALLDRVPHAEEYALMLGAVESRPSRLQSAGVEPDDSE